MEETKCKQTNCMCTSHDQTCSDASNSRMEKIRQINKNFKHADHLYSIIFFLLALS